jgi:formylmethanofuran dehydrogenase subunit E
MALLSGSEQEWNERARISNYRCRDCREFISFGDQELYFQQGLCTPCLTAREEERRTSSEPRKRLEHMRSRAMQKE